MVTVLQKPADPDAILAAIREAAIVGLERRLRAAAARAKRYAEKISRRTRRPEDIRADAETLLQRAVAAAATASH